MTQAIAPDAWTETFLITIQKKGGTAIEFAATVTTYDVTGGEKDFTQIANGAGGRIKQFNFQTPKEIMLEAFSLEAGTDTGTEGKGFADLLGAIDATQPISVSADHTRDLYLLAIKHTTSTSDTSAVAVTADGDRAERDVYINGHFVSYVTSMTDGIRKHTIKYKVTPFDKSGNSNITNESTDGSVSATLAAVTYP